MTYETKVLSVIVKQAGQPIYSETATIVTIVDEAAGPFLEVRQETGGIFIDPDEWPALRAAIDEMVVACEGIDGKVVA